MKRQHALFGGLMLVALVAVGVWSFPRIFRSVEDEVPVPPTGEAAYNPLYALKLALQQHGRPVSPWANLAGAERALAPGDTLLLYDRPEAMSRAQAERLLRWVRGGGHLLIPGPPEGESAGPLADMLGLRAVDPAEGEDKDEGLKGVVDEQAKDWLPPGCVRLRVAGPASASATATEADASGRKYARQTWLCDPAFVANVPGFTLSGGDEVNGWRFARRQLDAGLVTVAELDYLDNEGLRQPEARAMAWQLLAPRLASGRVHLVYSADVPSLLRLLITYGWMVLLPLALALAVWLAWRGQRFGPLQPVPAPRRRALMEHVQAAGEFAWARGRASALHAAVLRLFRRRLQLREPELAALDEEKQALALANQLSLPASRVRQALRPQGLQHPATFTQSIATLLQMRSRL